LKEQTQRSILGHIAGKFINQWSQHFFKSNL
jgi:hypothetical protein